MHKLLISLLLAMGHSSAFGIGCQIVQLKPKATWNYVVKIDGKCLLVDDGQYGVKHGTDFITGVNAQHCPSLMLHAIFKTAAAADAVCRGGK